MVNKLFLNSNSAIGVFDSGIGGLTVVRHLQEQLPNENIIYLGDTARVPYGNKSSDVIVEYSLEITNFLMSKKVKCIVIACNTASAYAYDAIRLNYPDVPIFGMIETGSLYAVSKTQNKNIAIIGTSATIQSKLYEMRIKSLDSSVNTIAIPCPLFVPIVEEHLLTGSIVEQIIDMYLSSLRKSQIDTLIMGCTHYPLLRNELQNYFGDEVYLVDSGKSAAVFVREQLKKMGLLNSQTLEGFLHCYLTCRTPKFIEMAELCISRDIQHLEHIEIETVHINTTNKSDSILSVK